MIQKILFITWDSADTNYLEGLFLPILQGLTDEFNVHIIQFTWANSERQLKTKNICEAAGTIYTPFTIIRKPHPLPGTITTLVKGISFLKNYISTHNIDIVLPRSIFPALMILKILNKFPRLKLIFDADGLPLEERIDFSGLTSKNWQYKFLKKIEFNAIIKSDAVLTRTYKAIKILVGNNKKLASKFSIVTNGRNHNLFQPYPNEDLSIRNKIKLSKDDVLLVYVGSLGPQYCVNEMIYLYEQVKKQISNTYLLILTNNPQYISDLNIDTDQIIVKKVDFEQVPKWLSSADVGLAIREATFSMQGVAPIKLGEYLLTGLPIIASAGIGDTEDILKNELPCFILKDHSNEALIQASEWIINILNKRQELYKAARALGLKYFSLEKSIESYREVLHRIS